MTQISLHVPTNNYQTLRGSLQLRGGEATESHSEGDKTVHISTPIYRRILRARWAAKIEETFK